MSHTAQMSKKETNSGSKPKKPVGRPAGGTFPVDESPVQARLVPEMRAALKALALRNGTKESEEVRAAIREHLLRNQMWPPKN